MKVIRNTRYARKAHFIGNTQILFDENGVVTVPDELAAAVKGIAGFEVFQPVQPDSGEETAENEGESVEEAEEPAVNEPVAAVAEIPAEEPAWDEPEIVNEPVAAVEEAEPPTETWADETAGIEREGTTREREDGDESASLSVFEQLEQFGEVQKAPAKVERKPATGKKAKGKK